MVLKFRYFYSDGELLSWRRTLLEGAEQTGRAYVLFKNCYRDYAVKNARRMKCLLGLECDAARRGSGGAFPRLPRRRIKIEFCTK